MVTTGGCTDDLLRLRTPRGRLALLATRGWRDPSVIAGAVVGHRDR